jgi:hypothetical protein
MLYKTEQGCMKYQFFLKAGMSYSQSLDTTLILFILQYQVRCRILLVGSKCNRSYRMILYFSQTHYFSDLNWNLSCNQRYGSEAIIGLRFAIAF